MIITCPCEKKQFKIDSSLIPVEGRELQCGSCERVWFYKPQNEREAPLTLNDNNSTIKTKQDIQSEEKNIEISKKLDEEKIIEPEIKKEISKNVRKTKSKVFKLFSYLIVFIISFVALITAIKYHILNLTSGCEYFQKLKIASSG